MTKRTRFSFSVGGPVAADAVRDGLDAERLGYDFVWAADHLTDIPPVTAVFDAWTLLAYIGAKTAKVMLASGVTDIQRMHPAKAASTVSTLDNLTGGRAVLGIGAGEVMNTKPYGMEWEVVETRVKRFREYLKVVKLLWASSSARPVTFEGEFYSLEEAHLALSPFRSDPPIYIGAFASNAMLGTVGDLGDGWFPGIFYTPDTFRNKVAVIKESAGRAGRKLSEIDVVANVPIVLQPDQARLQALKAKFKRTLVTSPYMLKLLGADETYENVSKELRYQVITPTAENDRMVAKTVKNLRISDDLLETGIREMMAVGSADQCIDSLERFVKAGAGHFHVQTYGGGREELGLIARKVVAHFRS